MRRRWVAILVSRRRRPPQRPSGGTSEPAKRAASTRVEKIMHLLCLAMRRIVSGEMYSCSSKATTGGQRKKPMINYGFWGRPRSRLRTQDPRRRPAPAALSPLPGAALAALITLPTISVVAIAAALARLRPPTSAEGHRHLPRLIDAEYNDFGTRVVAADIEPARGVRASAGSPSGDLRARYAACWQTMPGRCSMSGRHRY